VALSPARSPWRPPTLPASAWSGIALRPWSADAASLAPTVSVVLVVVAAPVAVVLGGVVHSTGADGGLQPILDRYCESLLPAACSEYVVLGKRYCTTAEAANVVGACDGAALAAADDLLMLLLLLPLGLSSTGPCTIHAALPRTSVLLLAFAGTTAAYVTLMPPSSGTSVAGGTDVTLPNRTVTLRAAGFPGTAVHESVGAAMGAAPRLPSRPRLTTMLQQHTSGAACSSRRATNMAGEARPTTATRYEFAATMAGT
jgi:hypothetical protein